MMSKLMKLHEELDKSFMELANEIEHRKLRIDENVLIDIIAKIDCLKVDLLLQRGGNYTVFNKAQVKED